MAALLLVMVARAQETGTGLSAPVAQPMEPQVELMDQPTDSLRLPTLNRYGQMPTIGMYPLYWGGVYDRNLHEGLNVNLGASVFASFGRHSYRGAGFQQNVSLMYATPLSNKLSLAVGGYMNNLNWHHNNWRDAGLSAVLGYRFDEHWEAYLYGQKSLTSNRRFMPLPLYDMSNLGDRIGAAVKYNFSPSFSIQVSVERGESPWSYGERDRFDWQPHP